VADIRVLMGRSSALAAVVQDGEDLLSAAGWLPCHVRPDELMAYLVLSLPASAHPGQHWSQPLVGGSAGDLMRFATAQLPAPPTAS
jgi:hypothetical protein